LEIIIGDNSDNNKTKDVIESKYVSDIRIKYYKHPQNIGMAKNFDFIRYNAKGKYYLSANDDDYWDITFIEKAVAKLESNNDAVACWSRFLYIGESGILENSGGFDNQDLSSDNLVDNLVRYNMQLGWYEIHALYRLSLWKRLDIQQFQTTGADIIVTNLVLLSGKCLFIDEPLFFYSLSLMSAFDRYRGSELFNEYAQINPHLDLFVKIFHEIIQTKKLSIFQKMLFYVKLWYQILFKNHTWIDRFCLYPQKNFFKLAFTKKNFFIFFVLFPFFIYHVIEKTKEKMSKKLLRVKEFLQFFHLVLQGVKANTVLIIEPHNYHHEVVPGYAKYFVDLGYALDIIMLPETKQDNVFCRYHDRNIHLHRLTLKMMTKYVSLKRLYRYSVVFVTTYYPKNYDDQEFYGKIFYKTLFLSKRTKLLCVHYLPSNFTSVVNSVFVVLKDMYPVSDKPLMVNPHFFGKSKILPKNKTTNFIVVGSKETSRRNYLLLTDTFEKLIKHNITNFHITLIGSGNVSINKSVESYFTTLEHVDFPTLFQYLEQADFILALLDPENPEHEEYVDRKTSGTFQLSYGFLKPIILCKKFTKGTGFTNENALIYDNNSMFESVLRKAIFMDNKTYAQLRDNLMTLEKDISRRSLKNLKSLIIPPPPVIPWKNLHKIAFGSDAVEWSQSTIKRVAA
jgi:hypothetical protein